MAQARHSPQLWPSTGELQSSSLASASAKRDLPVPAGPANISACGKRSDSISWVRRCQLSACQGSGALSDNRAWLSEAETPEDKRYGILIRRMMFELFPREERDDGRRRYIRMGGGL